jgi:hypothetical protein
MFGAPPQREAQSPIDTARRLEIAVLDGHGRHSALRPKVHASEVSA